MIAVPMNPSAKPCIAHPVIPAESGIQGAIHRPRIWAHPRIPGAAARPRNDGVYGARYEPSAIEAGIVEEVEALRAVLAVGAA